MGAYWRCSKWHNTWKVLETDFILMIPGNSDFS
jgi:hypothetical protein